jgi:Fe-S cluster biogenesis protein NfuA
MTETVDKDLISRVEMALQSIRPYLESDGGNIKLISITKDKIVKLKLLGNCADCSMSSMTMKAGVEDAIRKAVPEITKIETV